MMSNLRRRSVLARVTLCALVMGFSVASARAAPEITRLLTPDEVRAELEKLAGEIAFWPLAAVLYDRERAFGEWAEEAEAARHRAIYRRLKDRALGTQALEPLLKHDDPKVRTLALTALFDRCDPKHLPAIAALAGDAALTFDSRPRKIPEVRLMFSGVGPPEPEQGVGGFAVRMIEMYTGHRKFDDYWATHGSRAACAGWFRVRALRAGNGTYPAQEDRRKPLQEVRRAIERLPADYGTFVFLYLAGDQFTGGVISSDELAQRCAALESETLMLFLEGKVPSDDPDLQWQKDGPWWYASSQLFILRRAKQLLKPEHVPRLKQCMPLLRRPDWAIAMAELDPANARTILREALPNYQERSRESEKSQIPVALWRLCGDAESDFVRDWFFTAVPQQRTHPHCREAFIRGIFAADETRAKVLLAQLLADPRFDRVDAPDTYIDTLQDVDRRVSKWIGKKPLEDQDFYVPPPELDRRMAEVRNSLRASVPEWLPKK